MIPREQFVFDELIKDHWEILTIKERADAIRYIGVLGGNTRGMNP